MDWIHCNSCYKQPSQGEPRQFFLTSCGHFYCDLCLKPDNNEKCRVCRSDFTTTLLSNQLRPDVQEYFQDTTESLKKLVQIVQFQNGHRQKIAAHSKQVAVKYKAAKEEMKKLFDANKALKKRNAELEAALKRTERKKPPVDVNVSVHGRGGSQPSTPFFQSQPGEINQSLEVETSARTVSSNSSQVSQMFGGSQSSSGTWLTPNRLTLQFNKSLSNKDGSSPSPGSVGSCTPYSHTPGKNITPQKRGDSNKYASSQDPRYSQKQKSYHDGYRNCTPQYSSQSTPLVHKRRTSMTPDSSFSPSQSPGSPRFTPNTAEDTYSRSKNMPPPAVPRSRYNASQSPITPPTIGMSLVNIYSQRGRSGQT